MKIKVIVKPNSKTTELTFDSDKSSYIARISEPAFDNKANIALLKLLSKHISGKARKCNCALHNLHFKAKARIISGASMRTKIIDIEKKDPARA